MLFINNLNNLHFIITQKFPCNKITATNMKIIVIVDGFDKHLHIDTLIAMHIWTGPIPNKTSYSQLTVSPYQSEPGTSSASSRPSASTTNGRTPNKFRSNWTSATYKANVSGNSPKRDFFSQMSLNPKFVHLFSPKLFYCNNFQMLR
jgi:hypothetical protein